MKPKPESMQIPIELYQDLVDRLTVHAHITILGLNHALID